MMSLVNIVDSSVFTVEVNEVQDMPVLVDFWAPWCGYCTKLLPVLDEIAPELSGKIKIVKVNVDENRDLAQQYGVMSLPTLLLFKKGEELDRITGFLPKAALLTKLQAYL